MSNPFQKLLCLFQFDKVLFTILFIALPGVILDGLVEYNAGGYTLFFMRALLTFGVIVTGLICYKFSLIGKAYLLTISVYTIVLTMMASLVIGIQDPNFQFEPFFLKVEVILALLVFAVGMLVHFRHIIVLLGFNIFFMVCCFLFYPDFPIEKFAFYGVIVSGGGLMAYISQRMVVRLSRKVKEANKLIIIKNQELREMNRSKDQLFRIIGHDLRTPFYQLRSLVDMIDEVEEEHEKAEIKNLLKESANKGNQLLEDLLKWGNTYKQQSEVLIEKQELSVIVKRVFEFSDLKRKTKQISLINELPKGLKIPMNPPMMETVLRNLVANAIKFSHRGSDIVIQSEKVGRQVRIAIVDNGVGMCKDRLCNLFSNDKNESTTGTENETGTGFGLSIAKKLVERQNGTFEIESEQHKGTTVNMYFPLGLSA